MLWGPNQPVVSEDVSPEVDWPEPETYRSGPSGTEGKNVYNCTVESLCPGSLALR